MQLYLDHFLMLSKLKHSNDAFKEDKNRYYCEECIDEMFDDVKQEYADFTSNERMIFHKLFKKSLSLSLESYNNQKHSYLITFTIDDAKIKGFLEITDEAHLKTIEDDIIKLFLNKQVLQKITACDWVREGNKQDGKRPHWHYAITIKGYVESRWFDKYKKYYGLVDIKILHHNDENKRLDYFITDKKPNIIHKMV